MESDLTNDLLKIDIKKCFLASCKILAAFQGIQHQQSQFETRFADAAFDDSLLSPYDEFSRMVSYRWCNQPDSQPCLTR
jgi:hypothetical protein